MAMRPFHKKFPHDRGAALMTAFDQYSFILFHNHRMVVDHGNDRCFKFLHISLSILPVYHQEKLCVPRQFLCVTDGYAAVFDHIFYIILFDLPRASVHHLGFYSPVGEKTVCPVCGGQCICVWIVMTLNVYFLIA